jgi:flagellar basal body-associated protein FliL
MADEATAEAPKKGGMKTIIIVAAIMIVEAAAVFGIMKFTMGSNTNAQSAELEGEEENDRERPVEIELVRDKFQNMSTGRVWQWEVHVFLRVRNKNVERVEAEKEKRRNEIEEGVARIIRSAQDRHLREPGLESITRQLNQYVNEVFGYDQAGIPRVERVIIPKCMGAPMDY